LQYITIINKIIMTMRRWNLTGSSENGLERLLKHMDGKAIVFL